MKSFVELIIIAEGKIEQLFLREVLGNYLLNRNIYIYVMQTAKHLQKGGDVKFDRIKRELNKLLHQRQDISVATFVDYYGLAQWPGLTDITPRMTPADIAHTLIIKVKEELSLLPGANASRYLPFIAVHEFEALLYSDAHILAEHLGIDERQIEKTLLEAGSSEAINNSRDTSPAKCLLHWSSGKYRKVESGIAIAREIGIDNMRLACPNFNAWLNQLEQLQ